MQFRIKVQTNAEGWQVQIIGPDGDEVVDPQTGSALRQLRRVGEGVEVFPQPPEATSALLAAQGKQAPHRALCQMDLVALQIAYGRIVGRSPGEQGTAHFGRYLFDTLLGQGLWGAIVGDGRQALELELAWQNDTDPINRLPWEMMGQPHPQSPEETIFLAAQSGPPIAIVRRIIGANQQVGTITSPPRVLFVIGADLTDSQIHPGAEYLGLLRALQNNGLNLRFKDHLLIRASPERLRAAIEWFKPTIIHFICHGGCDAYGRCYLEFVADEGTGGKHRLYGADLQRLLSATSMPQIVVLNACYTADMGSKDQYAQAGQVTSPIAVELVRGDALTGSSGVPIVVGMAGEVADRACRLFTRCFYEALLQGGDISHAAAQGRRMGILNYGGMKPEGSVDWALPTLFLADGVDTARLEVEAEPLEQHWQIAARKYAYFAYPPFCGRMQYLYWYDVLMANDRFQNTIASSREEQHIYELAFIVPKNHDQSRKYGRTRLLHELAAQAVRDGHVPCLLNKEMLEAANVDWPTDIPELLDALMAAADRTVELLGLTGWNWQYTDALRNINSGEALPDFFPEELDRLYKRKDQTDLRLLGRAFKMDLYGLLLAARAMRPPEDRERTRLLLLVDDVDSLGYKAAKCLLDGLLGEYGLRGAGDWARIVLAYTQQGKGDDKTVGKLLEDRSKLSWRKDLELKEFQKPEDILVYKQFLLQWRDQNKPGGELRPLMLAPGLPPQYSELVMNEFDETIQGIPSFFETLGVQNKMTKLLVTWPKILKRELLCSADDEQLLRMRQENRWGAGQ